MRGATDKARCRDLPVEGSRRDETFRPVIDFRKVNEATFVWDTHQERSFQELKDVLTNAPVLAFTNLKSSFELYIDASGLGLRSVFMQKDDRGKSHVIAFASRALNKAEANYSVTHQETLAVVWTLNHFKDIIFGYLVTVFTDHAAITELFKEKI